MVITGLLLKIDIKSNTHKISKLLINGQTINVEIADSDGLRSKGLSGTIKKLGINVNDKLDYK